MLVAQITDIHLGFDRDDPAELNRRRLDETLRALAGLDPQPDLLLATGDLVDNGDVGSYRRLRAALAACRLPVYPCLGNHDDRATFRTVFPDVPVADGFVQYVVDTAPVRFVILDTLEEGRHGGGFCTVRAAWLRAMLAAAPVEWTVIVLHHPPFDTGIGWMTTHPDEPWVARLRAALDGHRQVVGLVCGHIHRTIVTRWAGVPLIVCPSTAPQVALTLAVLDPEVPDRRPLIVAESPGYALHFWNGNAIVSHFDTAPTANILARFDKRTQPMIRAMVGERPGC
jgi:Icc protein